MEKNPVSLLQEYMTKKRVNPIYTLIEQKSGSNVNVFKMRVQCENDIAEGRGSNKKEAKVNAAIKMLNSLNINQNEVLDNNAADATSSCINYVGKLQEFAAKKSDKLPEYIPEATTGMPHKPLFTVLCKYNKLEERACGYTKKEAKNSAAKKMYDKVSSEIKMYVPETEVETYLETINKNLSDLKLYNTNQATMQRSAIKAEELFLPLSKTTYIKKLAKDGMFYDECHTFLRDSFSVKEREIVIDKLEDTINVCKSHILCNNKIHAMKLLKTALDYLNISIKEIDYGFQNEYTIFNLQLDTNPVISEIGFGKNKDEAQIQTIFQMAKTVSLMLH